MVGRCESPAPEHPGKDLQSATGKEGNDPALKASSVPEPASIDSSPWTLPPTITPTIVLPEDQKTPDNHVQRDPRLIRLTGQHPFNCEPPLVDLYEQGFLANENLHFVRNHGAVPRCEDEQMLDWTFTVEGMVENPVTLSVKELLESFDQRTYPVTLVCAGNRRKEQNTVRKSKGFSWGASGLSTALWTGVAIGDVLAKAKPLRGARYVCFEGADPLPNGNYGTSLKLNWCQDINKGIMIAHRMNGKTLHPDHGKPVRILVPGQIGGRSVKWLKKIRVTAEPSDNWYHIYDNRVLPTMITPEESDHLPDTWKDERYAIYDLNVNSAICSPRHDERLHLASAHEKYTVRGYAYGGGGRRIGRVEISLDKGNSWQLASIRYPEDDYRLASDSTMLYGGKLDMSWRETCFCWCFWELDMTHAALDNASDIFVRAMDEGMMVQPRDMYWSVLGMMNNPWFRVVIHKEHGSLRFEHPTQPRPGGWMERVKQAGGNLVDGFWGEARVQTAQEAKEAPKDEISLINPKTNRTITIDELNSHSSDSEPWFVINGQVYDGTEYAKSHPGGAVSISGAAGQDVTEDFMGIHSENAKAMMPQYHVGTLDDNAKQVLLNRNKSPVDSGRLPGNFLKTNSWSTATLFAKTTVSPDSKIFHFRWSQPDQEFGLPIGQHVMMRLRDQTTQDAIIRAYTPISHGTAKGTVDILIKIYRDTPEHAGGKLTQALDALSLGRTVDFKGPVGRFVYLGNGNVDLSGKQRRVKRFVMICGGSGVTPMYQVLRAVADDPADSTKCLVLVGNNTEDDILCRSELDTMATESKNQTELVHCIMRPLPSWTGPRGIMDKEFLVQHVGNPKQGDGSEMVLVCGPDAMVKHVNDVLSAMGWNADDIFVF